MRTLLVIGIGPGDPTQVTVQAIEAMNRADAFVVLDKGADTAELVGLREEICRRYLRRPYRFVHVPDPPRDRQEADYRAAVEDWHARRAELIETTLRTELPEDGCGAFLVWGDPSLYDSTLRILDRIRARGALPFAQEVIPGVTSVSSLAARHGIVLNGIGNSVRITTGRRLPDAPPRDGEDVVVMLDGDCAFRRLDDPALDIYWGAYLGTAEEVLVAGKLGAVADRIERVRNEARARKGWIMDTYLLRRGPAPPRDEGRE